MIPYKSPLDAFLHWEKTTPNKAFLKQPINGKTTVSTFKEAGIEARKLCPLDYFRLSNYDVESCIYSYISVTYGGSDTSNFGT